MNEFATDARVDIFQNHAPCIHVVLRQLDFLGGALDEPITIETLGEIFDLSENRFVDGEEMTFGPDVELDDFRGVLAMLYVSRN